MHATFILSRKATGEGARFGTGCRTCPSSCRRLAAPPSAAEPERPLLFCPCPPVVPAARGSGAFCSGDLAPSPVAPATGRLCRFSTRRQVPAYRRQAAGLSGKINIVKLAHYPELVVAVFFRRSFANTLLQGGTRPFPKQRASSRLGTGGRKGGALRRSKWSLCSHIRQQRFWRTPCSRSRGRVAARALRNQQPGGSRGRNTRTCSWAAGWFFSLAPSSEEKTASLTLSPDRTPSVRIGLPPQKCGLPPSPYLLGQLFYRRYLGAGTVVPVLPSGRNGVHLHPLGERNARAPHPMDHLALLQS